MCKEELEYFRSSQERCSVKKGAFRNFTKFTGKHLCQSLFFRLQKLDTYTRVPKTMAQVFSCEFCEISKNTFFTDYSRTTASERRVLPQECNKATKEVL